VLEKFSKSHFILPPGAGAPDLSKRGVLDLFSGSKRHARYCIKIGFAWVLTYEYNDDPKNQNLLESDVRDEIETLLRGHAFLCLGAGPVCSSLSRAVTPAVRDKAHPYGLKDISDKMKAKVREGNSFGIWMSKLVNEFHAQLCIWIENPDSSFLWLLPEWRRIFRNNVLGYAKLDYCRFGAPWRKRTRFATNMSNLVGIRALCTRDHAHTVLRGHSSKGGLWTKIAEPYPHAIANILSISAAIECGILRAKLDVVKSSHVATRRAQATGKF